ncbi:spermatogenesis-associated protein 6-like [Ornithodoros turicata]|uniref:spermatogenesis-associated protein 6-like n=1 Tax=Ornithodoros turicata TaxID=34597 RepID=UPI00313877C2
MPTKALKCCVNLKIKSISCPGVWFRRKHELQLNIVLFDSFGRTKLLPASFPLTVYEEFIFQKASTYCTDLTQMAAFLEEESIYIELVQRKQSSETVLASVCTDARNFLYPSPTLSRSYSGPNRELLMETTRNFPGMISPKLCFATSTMITESDREAQRPPSLPRHILVDSKMLSSASSSAASKACPHHKEHVCTVCNLYKKHFGSLYGGHNHIPFSGHTRWFSAQTRTPDSGESQLSSS